MERLLFPLSCVCCTEEETNGTPCNDNRTIKGDSETIIAEEVSSGYRFTKDDEGIIAESALVVVVDNAVVDNPGSVLGMGLFDNEGFGGGAAVHFFIFFFFNGSRWADVEEVNEDDDKGKNVESALSAAIATFCFLRGIDRKSTRLNSSHDLASRMPSSA